MSSELLHAIKTCGWPALSQVEVPEPLHPFRLLLPSYRSFIHFSQCPSSHLSKKVNKQFPPFFSMEDPHPLCHPSLHSYPSHRLHPSFFVNGEREHLPSSWIIHNQFHAEPNRQKNKWMESKRFKCGSRTFLTCFSSSRHELPWSSALFHSRNESLWSIFFFCSSCLQARSF